MQNCDKFQTWSEQLYLMYGLPECEFCPNAEYLVDFVVNHVVKVSEPIIGLIIVISIITSSLAKSSLTIASIIEPKCSSTIESIRNTSELIKSTSIASITTEPVESIISTKIIGILAIITVNDLIITNDAVIESNESINDELVENDELIITDVTNELLKLANGLVVAKLVITEFLTTTNDGLAVKLSIKSISIINDASTKHAIYLTAINDDVVADELLIAGNAEPIVASNDELVVASNDESTTNDESIIANDELIANELVPYEPIIKPIIEPTLVVESIK